MSAVKFLRKTSQNNPPSTKPGLAAGFKPLVRTIRGLEYKMVNDGRKIIKTKVFNSTLSHLITAPPCTYQPRGNGI